MTSCGRGQSIQRAGHLRQRIWLGLLKMPMGVFHLGTLSIPSNSLLISEGIKEEPWLCNRQGQALVWKGDW